MNAFPPQVPPSPEPRNSSVILWSLVGCGLLSAAFGLIVMIVLGFFFVRGFQAARLTQLPGHSSYALVASPGTEAPPEPLHALPDADVLAQRMKWEQDYYPKLRDEALAGYLQLHPNPVPYDDEAHAALKLLAYLSIWGDYYGEGLWQQYECHASHLDDEGAKFSVWSRMRDVHDYAEDYYSSSEESARASLNEALDFQTTHYPAYFKFLIYKSLIEDLITARGENAISPGPGNALDKLPQLAGLATGAYGEMLRAHLPPMLLYRSAADLIYAAIGDEPTILAITDGLDHAIAANDHGDPLADALKGDFYVRYAWTARGDGEANTVTDQGWQLFGDRLAKANQVLTTVYAAHPDQLGVPSAMMTVVLGLQQPRDQMELWYQRGLKVTPDPFPLNMSKRWYLLPRWYGSDEDVWAFGLECAKSDDWATKTPMMLFECTTDEAERNPGIYTRPDIWTPLERVFRGYLDHFPDAVTYRSHFIKCAVEGGHWGVAAEQMKLIGNYWDRSVFEGDEYLKARRLVASHSLE